MVRRQPMNARSVATRLTVLIAGGLTCGPHHGVSRLPARRREAGRPAPPTGRERRGRGAEGGPVRLPGRIPSNRTTRRRAQRRPSHLRVAIRTRSQEVTRPDRRIVSSRISDDIRERRACRSGDADCRERSSAIAGAHVRDEPRVYGQSVTSHLKMRYGCGASPCVSSM